MSEYYTENCMNNNKSTSDSTSTSDIVINNMYLIQTLLLRYDKVMYLKLFVDSDDYSLKQKYIESIFFHNKKIMENPEMIDSGFDLYTPGNDNLLEKDFSGDEIRFFGPGWNDISPVNKIDFNVCCSSAMYCDNGKIYNTGYKLYPRSSLSKTQLRLANSTGIIDAGYRGHIMGMFDVVNKDPKSNDEVIDSDYHGHKFDRYVQICSPTMGPIIVQLVETKDSLGLPTKRNDGGFGSTGI